MSRWPAGLAAASLFFAAFSLFDYFGRPLAGAFSSTLLLTLLCLSAAGSGRLLLVWLGLSDLGDSERTLLGFTLGLGLLALGTFTLAAAGLLRPWSVVGLVAVLWVLGSTELRAMAGSLGANLNLLSVRPATATAVLGALTLTFITTWAPPHQYDSLVYHLPLPEAYIRAGRLVAPEHLVYSHFPQNGEMLFTLALLLKSDLLAQMLVWVCTAASVWWVFEAGKREAPLTAVLVGCGLLVTHSSVMVLSGTTYVEPIVMLWCTASVLSFYRWRGMSSGQAGQRSWLALSAMFCGLALGTKYYAGITAGVLGLTLAGRVLTAPRDLRRARAFELLLFTGVTTTVFSPWLIKNALFVGNPVFPFLYRWFPATAVGWTADTARDYFRMLTEYGHEGRFWSDLVRLPLLLLSGSQRFGGGMDALGTTGWELSFWLLPVAIWAGRGNRFLRGLLFYLACHLAAWFGTRVVLRFLVPVAPLLCLLAGVAAHALWLRLGRAGRVMLGAAVGLLTFQHLLLFGFMHALFGSLPPAVGLEDRDAFLSRKLDYYPCARWAAAHLDKNDKILLVGEQRSYYLERDRVATTVHAPNRFLAQADAAEGPAALARSLAADGLTHLLLTPREMARLGAGMTPMTARAQANLAALEPAHLEKAFQGAACRLYRLKAQP